MNALKEHCIHIDHFRLNPKAYKCTKLFLLTHCHSDHIRHSMTHFPHPIYCSAMTASMLSFMNVQFNILSPNRWYTIHDIEFYVFETLHCPGSIGVYFKELKIMFLGDTRLTDSIKLLMLSLPVHTVLLNDTHTSWLQPMPSIDESLISIQQLLLSKRDTTTYLALPHLGSVIIPQRLQFTCKLDPSLAPCVAKWMRSNGFENDASHIVAVGRQSKRIDVFPSSLFFVVNDFSPSKVIEDNGMQRIFISFHASQEELQFVKQHATFVEFV